MNLTLEQLMRFLTYVATPVGAGVIGSLLFGWLRGALPLTEGVTGLRAVIQNWIYTPQLARRTANALAWLVATGATVGAALLTGADASAALDTALAAILSGFLGVATAVQLHGEQALSRQLPVPASTDTWGEDDDDDDAQGTAFVTTAPSPFDGPTDPRYPTDAQGRTPAQQAQADYLTRVRETPDANGAIV